jgi:hypothetical protein
MLSIGLALALCIAAGASAADSSPFFADIQSGAVSTVKATSSAAGYGSDYGYPSAQTETACLTQLNFKNCR